MDRTELGWLDSVAAVRYLVIMSSPLETLSTVYYLAYIVFSWCGLLIDPLLFTYHLAELFIIIPAGKDLVDTVATNMHQLIITLGLGFVITYIYAVIGWVVIRSDQTGFGTTTSNAGLQPCMILIDFML
jgi:hypothetical protein